MTPEIVARFQTLFDAPAPAALVTYRKDGSAAVSPVWFRVVDGRAEVVVADSDVKLTHLSRRPQCSLLIFETVPPFRGVRLEGEPCLRRDGVTDVRLAIASRYLGTERGALFTAARSTGVVVSLPLDEAQSWDLTAILPADAT
ncbi:pyridoxamine 5'-phosphate oxidase family protein [Intrasporangium sp.]|uniref:pyridoxamine 5'-phosphate oxidase family protein n=1 Tax=Intrasporangium sp. TaxID=1925024 RepID=UPI003221723F